MEAFVGALVVVVFALCCVVVQLVFDVRYHERRVRELGWRVGFLSGKLSPEERAAIDARVAEYLDDRFGRRKL